MISKLLASRSGRALLLTASVALSFLLSAIILRHGLRSWPDSWYDWEGSVNIIEHGTFTNMLGVPIRDWQPLYSVYLAGMQLIFGQTGWTLMLSTSVLVAVNVALWGYYAFNVFPVDEKPTLPMTIGIMASLLFYVLFLALNFISILPNGLLLIFVCLTLQLLAAIAEDPNPWGGVKKSVLVGFLLGAGVFTHNSTIIYITAAIIVIFMTMRASLRHRLLAIGFILLISGASWICLPHGLSLAANHKTASLQAGGATARPIADQGTHYLFDPKYTFREYLVQTPEGFGVFFLSMSSIAAQAAVGCVILGTALYFLVRKPRSPLEARHRVYLGFGLLCVLGHFIVFNIVWLDTIFCDRFAWYFALICVPIFFYRLRHYTPVIAVMLVMTLGVSGWRVFKMMRTGKVPALVAQTNEITVFEIHPEYFLTSLPHAVVPAGAIQIEPPIYAWQSTLAGERPPNVHESVILIRPGGNSP